MLSKLFGTKSRVLLLKHFISRSDSEYNLKDVSRAIGLEAGPVARELDNLVKLGFITAVKKKSNKEQPVPAVEIIPNTAQKNKNTKPSKREPGVEDYYSLNHDFILLEELKSLILKAQLLYERDFIEKIQKIGRIYLFILTGFFVGVPDYEVDLLIVGKLNKQKFIEIIEELEKELQRPLNFAILEKTEFKFRLDMTDRFIYKVMEGKKLIVIDQLGV